MFVMLYICKRKVKVYSIYNARKRRSRRFSFFRFCSQQFFPKTRFPALCSFYFCKLLPAIHPIARGNHLHCSWQLAQLLVALKKKLVIFSKNIKDFFKFLFMFSKKLGGNFKKLANYSEKSASHSKKAVVVPENTGGASCIPSNG